MAALTHIAVRSYIFIRWEVPPSDFYTPIDYAVINPSDSVGVHLNENKNDLFTFLFFNATGCLRQSAIFSWHFAGTKPHQILLINDSFSSQTWAIFLPNRNFHVKSVLWPFWSLKITSKDD